MSEQSDKLIREAQTGLDEDFQVWLLLAGLSDWFAVSGVRRGEDDGLYEVDTPKGELILFVDASLVAVRMREKREPLASV